MTRRWVAEIVIEFDTDEPHADFKASDEANTRARIAGGYVNSLREVSPSPCSRCGHAQGNHTAAGGCVVLVNGSKAARRCPCASFQP
jgi:hypothetical protein